MPVPGISLRRLGAPSAASCLLRAATCCVAPFVPRSVRVQSPSLPLAQATASYVLSS